MTPISSVGRVMITPGELVRIQIQGPITNPTTEPSPGQLST
jgi:hypothetical protein